MKILESEYWRLWSDPSIGVQWLAAEVKKNGSWHSVVPDCRQMTKGTETPRPGQSISTPLAAANFHMIPYSNRIRDGRFTFNSHEYQLANAANHSIHGALRKLPWTITESSQSSLTCDLETSRHSEVNWPWPFRAQISQQIQGRILSSVLEIENQGSSSMPAGLGWHPYFVREIMGSQPTLTLPVNGVFPDAEGDCLPDGAAVALPDELDFTQPRPLDASQRIDCCLSGLEGTSVIDWQQAGIKLSLTASDNCRFLVLFNPDMPHFAVEPVSNANDAFNLYSQGIDSGTHILQPGEIMRAKLDIAFDG